MNYYDLELPIDSPTNRWLLATSPWSSSYSTMNLLVCFPNSGYDIWVSKAYQNQKNSTRTKTKLLSEDSKEFWNTLRGEFSRIMSVEWVCLLFSLIYIDLLWVRLKSIEVGLEPNLFDFY